MPTPTSSPARSRRRLRRITRPLSLAPLLLAALGTAAALSGGCSTGASRGFEQAFALDGQVAEWPNRRVALASPDYIYLRFAIDDEVVAQSGGDATTHLLLDIDNNPGTGTLLGNSPILSQYGADVPSQIADMGVDIEVRLTPPEFSGGQVAVDLIGYNTDGTPVNLNNSEVGFDFAPTTVNDWYEVRIERWGATDWPLAQASRASGVFLTAANGNLTGASEPFTFQMPRGSQTPPAYPAPTPAETQGFEDADGAIEGDANPPATETN